MEQRDTIISDLSSARCFALAAIAALGSSGLALAQDKEHGVEVSVLASSFFGGDSGPTVFGGPAQAETRYEDTFGSGFAVTAQYFRQIQSIFRWQIGVIHQSWPGEFFEGGEFQDGWAFGVGGQFDDLTLNGIYGGFTAIRGRGARIRPFGAMDLAIVNLSEVNVGLSENRQPYWKGTTKEYLLVRGGFAYEISPRASATFQVGFSVLGQPESVSVFTSATAGSALNLGIGFSYLLQ